MIELKDYSFADLSAYFKSNSTKALDKKLKTYGVEFSYTGKKTNRVYTIKAIHKRFKIACVFEEGIPPQVPADKFGYFLYLMMNDETFNWMSDEMMESELKKRGETEISRQTISKYKKKYLPKWGFSEGDYVYYKVFKDEHGNQKHEIVSGAEYSRAWAKYWEVRPLYEKSSYAFTAMYNFFGGVPRKQQEMKVSAWDNGHVQYLVSLYIDDLLDALGQEVIDFFP